jgi:hypothetical protein
MLYFPCLVLIFPNLDVCTRLMVVPHPLVIITAPSLGLGLSILDVNTSLLALCNPIAISFNDKTPIQFCIIMAGQLLMATTSTVGLVRRVGFILWRHQAMRAAQFLLMVFSIAYSKALI